MILVRFEQIPKFLLAGTRNGSVYRKALGLPKSKEYKVSAREDQCITASFILGFFKRENLSTSSFDLSTLTTSQREEFKRAVNRSATY